MPTVVVLVPWTHTRRTCKHSRLLFQQADESAAKSIYLQQTLPAGIWIHDGGKLLVIQRSKDGSIAMVYTGCASRVQSATP